MRVTLFGYFLTNLVFYFKFYFLFDSYLSDHFITTYFTLVAFLGCFFVH